MIRATRVAVVVLLGCSAASLAWLVSSELQGGDNGEFVALFARGGMAHPPGYPLQMAYAGLWRAAGATAPHAAVTLAAWASAVAVAAAAATLAGAVRLQSGSWLRGGVAAAALLSPLPVLLVATQAEAFALHVWLIAGVYLGVVLAERGRPELLPGFFALGLAQHHTLVFLAPWVAVSLWPHRRSARLYVGIVAGAALAALPFAQWWFVDPETQWVFAPVTSWRELLGHVLRELYGTTALTVAAARTPLRCAGFVASYGLSLPLLVLSLRAPRQSLHAARWAWIGWLCSGPIFGAIAAMDPAIAPAADLLLRFAAMPAALGAVGVGMSRVPVRSLWLPIAASAAQLAVGTTQLVQIRAGQRVDAYARALLDSAPQDAVVVTARDHVAFSVLALQLGERLRPDVQLVIEPLLGHAWYRARLSERGERAVIYDVPSAATLANVQLYPHGLFASDRPLPEPRWASHFAQIVGPGLRPTPGSTGCLVANDVLDARDRLIAVKGPQLAPLLSAPVVPCAE